MKSNYLQLPIASMAIIGLILSCNTSTAQADDLPSAKEVIANYVKAVGGLDKLKSIKTITQKGTIAIPAAGIEGTVVSYKNSKGQSYTKAEIAGMVNEEGTDGKTYWTMSTTMGPDIPEDQQKRQLKMGAQIDLILKLDQFFDKIECTGKEKFTDEECYVITATQKGVKEPSLMYFSVKNGYSLGGKMTAITPQGDMRVTSQLSDYKDVDGVMFPHKSVQVLPQFSIELVFTSTKINGKQKESLFKIPVDVQDLMED